MISEDIKYKHNGAASPDGADVEPALTPISLVNTDSPAGSGFSPLVTVVGFHHARGPEVETWFGADEGVDPAIKYNWPLLPFMALSDGAHASTVQKAVVVIADSPQSFGMLRERLSIVTQAWFAQREFTDTEILRRFQESLADEKARGLVKEETERDQHLGMSLREFIHEFKWQALVLLKCCLLQPKMLFFGSRCDRLCMVQFSLISLIPGLIRNLQDCADPELDSYEKKLAKPTTLQSSNRNSLLTFMGLPLQIFGKGGFFGPYTPLQQLDILADFGTKSYIVGSTNSLLLQQKDRYSDVLINLDEDTVSITSPSLKAALALTPADRRWIDFLTHEVNETWDEANPSRPKNMQYIGSEEFIRSQFEAYMLGLISSVKFRNFLISQGEDPSTLGADSDPAVDFGSEWVEAWKKTENYRIWDAHTDTNLFAVSEPKHPCAGGLTIDDIQRRVADQIKDLHLDERLAQGRDILGRNLAAGREKASTMLNKLYSDVEYLRESQRRRAEDSRTHPSNPKSSTEKSQYPVDLTKAQQTMNSVGAKASAYMSSWATWAGEKRKTGGWASGWGGKKSPSPSTHNNPSISTSPIDKDYQMVSPPDSRSTSTDDPKRHATHASFSESILSKTSERPVSVSSEMDDSFQDVMGSPDKVSHKQKDEDVTPKLNNDGFQQEDVMGAKMSEKGGMDDTEEGKGTEVNSE
ncbi:hypothetical protein MHUMG1_04936 [Metarhizium humberi]|uniref:AVL9/DENND6 domain-containing protein n=1 Tax=Metarhizium humberi TaxID=2596975 RepID=A0A9P8S840_9HYPO|nr:hypothetical protein MHUMG1_04936 [Metarhizium humberi]